MGGLGTPELVVCSLQGVHVRAVEQDHPKDGGLKQGGKAQRLLRGNWPRHFHSGTHCPFGTPRRMGPASCQLLRWATVHILYGGTGRHGGRH